MELAIGTSVIFTILYVYGVKKKKWEKSRKNVYYVDNILTKAIRK